MWIESKIVAHEASRTKHTMFCTAR